MWTCKFPSTYAITALLIAILMYTSAHNRAQSEYPGTHLSHEYFSEQYLTRSHFTVHGCYLKLILPVYHTPSTDALLSSPRLLVWTPVRTVHEQIQWTSKREVHTGLRGHGIRLTKATVKWFFVYFLVQRIFVVCYQRTVGIPISSWVLQLPVSLCTLMVESNTMEITINLEQIKACSDWSEKIKLFFSICSRVFRISNAVGPVLQVPHLI